MVFDGRAFEDGEHLEGGTVEGLFSLGGRRLDESGVLEGASEQHASVAPRNEIALAVQGNVVDLTGLAVEQDHLTAHRRNVGRFTELLEQLGGPSAGADDDPARLDGPVRGPHPGYLTAVDQKLQDLLVFAQLDALFDRAANRLGQARRAHLCDAGQQESARETGSELGLDLVQVRAFDRLDGVAMALGPRDSNRMLFHIQHQHAAQGQLGIHSGLLDQRLDQLRIGVLAPGRECRHRVRITPGVDRRDDAAPGP